MLSAAPDVLKVSTEVVGGQPPASLTPVPTAQLSSASRSLASNVDAIDELYADCTAAADGAIVEESLLGKVSAAMRAAAPDGWERLCASYGGEASLLARFATASERDHETTLSRVRATLEFRERERVHALVGRALPEALQADGPPDPRLEVVCKVRPFWAGTFCGLTRDGSPIQYHRVAYLDNELLLAFGDEQLRTFYMWWMETGLSLQRDGQQRTQPQPQPQPQQPSGEGGGEDGGGAQQTPPQGLMPKCIEVYDLQGVSSLRLARSALGLRSFARVISEIGSVHYPENLRKALVINAPRVVSLIASVVFSVLHERTRNKIVVTSGDGRAELAPFVDAEKVDGVFGSVDAMLRAAGRGEVVAANGGGGPAE